ncbi:hypothetical protein [Variovorax sp. GB1P17]
MQLLRDPGAIHSPGGGIGEDNAEVFGDWLSLDADEQARLHEEGVI